MDSRDGQGSRGATPPNRQWKKGVIERRDAQIFVAKISGKNDVIDPLYFPGIGGNEEALTKGAATGVSIGMAGKSFAENRVVLANLRSSNNLTRLLDNIDDITQLTNENTPEANKAFLKNYIVKLLKALDVDSNLPTERIDRIKDAIAELVGIDTRNAEAVASRNYQKNSSFLNDTSPLKFSAFDKNILILQLIARLIDPKRINQRQEQVCGVNSLMYAIAQDEPITYSRYIAELAKTGNAKLSFGGQKGLEVKISDEKIFRRPRRIALLKQNSERDYIDDVDFISLVGFRESQNDIFKFTENGSESIKSLFGVTFNHEIRRWMKNAGYSNVSQIKLNKPKDFKQLERLIQDGYSALFTTTVDLTDRIVFGTISDKTPSKLKQILFHGHLVQIKHISFNETTQEVKISIMTWGEETAEAIIPLKDFKKISGLSTATIGVSPYRKHEIREKVKRISESDPLRLHPQTFMQRVKTDLASIDWFNDNNLKLKRRKTVALHLPNTTYYLPEFLRDVIETIESTVSHQGGLSWQQGTKQLQDQLLAIEGEDSLSRLDEITRKKFLELRNVMLEYIVTTDSTAGEFLKKEINSDPAKVDQKQLQRLREAVAYLHDPGCLRKLVEVLVFQNKVEEALDIINKEKDRRENNGTGPLCYSSSEIALVIKALYPENNPRRTIASSEIVSAPNDTISDSKKIDAVIRHYENMLDPENQTTTMTKKLRYVIDELHSVEMNKDKSDSARLANITTLLNKMNGRIEPRSLDKAISALDKVILDPNIELKVLKDNLIPALSDEQAKEAILILKSQIERAERSYVALKNNKGRHKSAFQKLLQNIDQVLENRQGKMDADTYHFAMQELIKAYREQEKNYCLPYLGSRRSPSDFLDHLNNTPGDFEYPRLLAVIITQLMQQFPEFKTTNLSPAFQQTIDLIKHVKPGDNLIYLRLLSNDQTRIALGSLLGKIKGYRLDEKQIDILIKTKQEFLDKKIRLFLPDLSETDSLKKDINTIQMMGKELSANLTKFRRNS